MVGWDSKGVEGRSGTKMPSVTAGVVGIELLHRMLLKIKRKENGHVSFLNFVNFALMTVV